MILKAEELKSKNLENISINRQIDVNNAYEITKRLAFPRLVGSEGEKKALEIVLNEFKRAGYNTLSRDSFKTSFFNLIVLRYAFLPIGSCLILLALSFFINYWLTLGLVFLNFYIAKKLLGLATTDKIHLFRKKEKNYITENISTNLISKNSKKKVIFMAHWDSKSQTFPSSIRIILFLIMGLGFFIILFLYMIFSLIQLFFPFENFIFHSIMLYLSIIIVIISNFNYFNNTKNKSPGAYDNAAAVGIVIELAKYYRINPLDNVDLIFLCTSSEELNLGGAKYFIQNNKNALDKKTTYFINLDLIGGNDLIRLITSFGIPRKTSSMILKKLFLNSAKKLNINMKDIYLPTGAWSDYMPIVQEGFEACWLGSQPGLKFVHTKRDDMSVVSKEGIRNVLLLCIDVVNKLNIK